LPALKIRLRLVRGCIAEISGRTNFLAFPLLSRHTVPVSRRTVICLLATVISLAATQPVSSGTPRTGETASIVRLCRVRAPRILERESSGPAVRYSEPKQHAPARQLKVLQEHTAATAPRAPPRISAAI